MYQELIKFFDPEILFLEINPKESFGSQEINFIHKDVHHGIFYGNEKLKQKNKLDNNRDLVCYGTFVQEVIKIHKYEDVFFFKANAC